MNPGKIPFRMCIVCHTMREKKDLIRIVKDKQGNIFVDTTGKAAGRGAFVCREKACLEKSRAKKLLNKAFKCTVDAKVYETMIEESMIGQR